MAVNLAEVFDRDDVPDMDECNAIATAVETGKTGEMLAWLADAALGGATTEAKLAAILRGILLRFDREDMLEMEARERE